MGALHAEAGVLHVGCRRRGPIDGLVAGIAMRILSPVSLQLRLHDVIERPLLEAACPARASCCVHFRSLRPRRYFLTC